MARALCSFSIFCMRACVAVDRAAPYADRTSDSTGNDLACFQAAIAIGLLVRTWSWLLVLWQSEVKQTELHSSPQRLVGGPAYLIPTTQRLYTGPGYRRARHRRSFTDRACVGRHRAGLIDTGGMGRFPWLKKRSEATASPVQLHEVDGKAGRRKFGARDGGNGSAQAMDVDDDQSRRDSLSNLRCVSWGARHRAPAGIPADTSELSVALRGRSPRHVRPECAGTLSGRRGRKGTDTATRSALARPPHQKTHSAFRTVTDALSRFHSGVELD